MENFNTIIVEKEDHLATVTFDQPKSLNALNSEMMTEIGQAVDQIEADTDIRVVIFKGNGKAFIAGADIKEMNAMSPEESDAYSELSNGVYNRIAALRPVTISLVDGFALGGGAEFTLTTDIRVGTARSVFGFPEVGLGIIPGFGGTQRLPKVVGLSKAKELILSARNIKGEEALAIGLLSRIEEPEEIEEKTLELANHIISKAPLAVEAAKRAINASETLTVEEGLVKEAEEMSALAATEDRAEGMDAFVNKRSATFNRK